MERESTELPVPFSDQRGVIPPPLSRTIAPQFTPPPLAQVPPAQKSMPAMAAVIVPPVSLVGSIAGTTNNSAINIAEFPQKQPAENANPPTEMEVWQEKQRKRAVPSWLVSFIVHVVILLALAAAPIARFAAGPLTLLLGKSDGLQMSEFNLTSNGDSSEDVEAPEINELATSNIQTLDTDSLTSAFDAIRIPTGGTAQPSLEDLGLSEGFSGRSSAMKSALLRKYGGTPTTEAAVEAGLKWLVKNQRSDGSWSLTGSYSDGGMAENKSAATAMAINAFLGAGYTHKEGKYADVVEYGLRFLISKQDKEGFFSNEAPSRQKMYAQALATIAVCEAYGMTGDSKLRTPAAKAIKFAEWSQSNENAWRYEPKEGADLSMTGWYLMALMTGKMAGLGPDAKKIKNVSKYLDAVQTSDSSRYSYTEGERPSLSMTAVGLLCRQYLGWPKSHPAILGAIERDLLPSSPQEGDPRYSVYYWYYATQVLHHVGGEAWTQWNNSMREVLPAMQVKSGREAGSWSPDLDQFGASGGRLYTTCFNIYCLEVYYRHLSLYDLDQKGPKKR